MRELFKKGIKEGIWYATIMITTLVITFTLIFLFKMLLVYMGLWAILFIFIFIPVLSGVWSILMNLRENY